MKTSTRLLWSILLGAILLSGCSGNSVLQPNADISPGIDRESGAMDSHSLLGYWQGEIDPVSKTIEFTPLRETALHLNALPFLEPPANINLTLESVHVNGNIITADIGLTHPFSALTQFTGFDVCGIFIAKGSKTGFADTDIRMSGEGDTRLLNPDGYSRWWNPVEFPINDGTMFSYTDGLLGAPDSTADFNATLNGYKYFCDDLNDLTDTLADVTQAKRGMFSAGHHNVRRYVIELGQGLIFNYAVDASWRFPTGGPPYTAPDNFGPNANRPEAWNVSVTEVSNKLWNDGTASGGGLSLSIDIYDWFNPELNNVRVESPGNFPMTESSTPASGGAGFSTYYIEIPSATPSQNSIDLLISVGSEKTGYGGLLPGKTVTAYFTYSATINNLEPGAGWARTWGSDEYDSGLGVAIDEDGNIYLTGYFEGTADFDPGPGDDNHTSSGSSAVFLSKFNPNGVFQWARTWGGLSFDRGCGVTVDGSGNVYITGGFSDTVDFDPGPGIDDHTSNGMYDVFLSKFDSDGDFNWVRTWGGYDAAHGYGVALDENSNAYITGVFAGTTDFDPGTSTDYHTSNGEKYDVFLSKFDSDGDFKWARTWGASYPDFGLGVAIDGDGNAFITGYFFLTVDFDPGPGIDEHTAPYVFENAYLSKFDPNGNFQWVRTWGYLSTCGKGVTVDGNNNVYIAGYFEETVDFDTGSGVDNHTSNGMDDVFLSKLDSIGNFQWARTWGGNHHDHGYGVAADGNGNTYVTGDIADIVDFDPGTGTEYHISNGGWDVFLSKLNSIGDFQWARTWGGSGDDYGFGVAIDEDSTTYITGRFETAVDFDPGPGADNHSSNGHYDAFLSKFPPDGNW